MIGFVITGHGSFPNGLLESVQLIAGDIEQVEVIPFEESSDRLEKLLTQSIENVDTGSGVVCFADLAGGTPFNVSSKIASINDNIRVIGGANSPMLLSGLFQRKLPVDDFVDIVLKEGKENIKKFEVNVIDTVVDSDGI
ncbi:PTS sugar transporter subunit IIA [Aquibacillus saliphilus]|uniref:PTS sugar transporter subunit IIA n=1 Tax=Aquibacillus saliphilus TaxID=1909422 RepID=UPI001CF011AF|nr:hypothetical protein [Aquibacillus saliphilus]